MSLTSGFLSLLRLERQRKRRPRKPLLRAKTASEAREKAEREASELRAKYEPPKSDEIGPEPAPEQFTDAKEYGKALKDWTAENTRREDSKKAEEQRQQQEQARIASEWKTRQEAVKAQIEDYESVIASSEVKVSNEVRDAILESDIGPQLLYHFAKNPDEAERIGKFTVGRALRELGKLESKLAGGPATPAPKSQTSVAEISAAPAPITPLRGSTSVAGPKMDAENNFHGTYEDWKALRKAGKIK